jgi:hypothetical protein
MDQRKTEIRENKREIWRGKIKTILQIARNNCEERE